MQLTCPDCQVECTIDEQSAVTVTCPGCGVLLYSKSGRSGPLAAQLAIPSGQQAEVSEVDLEKTRQWQRSVDDVLPVPNLFPQRLGRYELRQKLGEGSFAEVYLAFDSELSREVALKIPRRNRFSSAEQLRRFLDEARTSAILEHPGIVRVYDIGWISDEVCFISMEYCSGGSLNERIKSEVLTCDRAVEVVESLADAIHFAHLHGFVHRDLKPSNVMIGRDGRPRIVDFGLALSDEEQLKHAGEIAGTLPYMSPEQLRGETHHLDGRTDIWSLGVILYQLLVGRRPFSGSRELVVDQIRNREAKPLRQIKDDVPVELEVICLRCLQKSPAARYPTAKDLAQDLRAFRERQAPSASMVMPVAALPPRRNFKSQWIYIGLAMLILIGCLGGLWAAFGLPRTRERDYPVGGTATEIVLSTNRFDGPSVIPDRWYPLLDRRPVEFKWPSDALPWRHEPQKQLLALDNRGAAYLELGTTDAEHFAIEVEMARSSWTSGHSGIFWGFHTLEANEAKVDCKWQTALFSIEADVIEQKLYFHLRLNRQLIELDGNLINISNSLTGEVDPGPPQATKVRFYLEIGKRGPIRLTWNGQPLDGIESRFLDAWGKHGAPYQSHGRFGVYNLRGSTTFRDARFMLLK